MNLVVETDLGRDPDDLLALCWLAAAGHTVAGLILSPGDVDQTALAAWWARRVDATPWIGWQRDWQGEKRSVNLWHHNLLRHLGGQLGEPPVVEDARILFRGWAQGVPAGERSLLTIGPPTVAAWAAQEGLLGWARVTLQGGFLGYHQHEYLCPRLDRFLGRDTCPTFNLGGDPRAATVLADCGGLRKRWVGKNVCHTIELTRDRLAAFQGPSSAAAELFVAAATFYLREHPGKLLHDPTAAVLHVDPAVGRWVRGTPYRERGAWGTRLDPRGDEVLADVDREALWHHLETWQ
jgi:inosine-uridine nucleoside N-ribohydrolase